MTISQHTLAWASIRPILITLFAELILLVSFLAKADIVALDKVVAVVRQDVVTESELNERMNEVTARARAAGVAPPDEQTLQTQVLEHLILEALQLQTAERIGLNVEDAEVNQTIKQVQQTNNMSAEQFNAQITRDGYTVAGFREKIRRDLTLQHIQRGVVSQRIEISDLEIDTFLKSAEGKFWTSPEFRLGHILLPIPQSASIEQVKTLEEKANKLVEELQNGARFQSLAIAHSKGPKALDGGDLGWRKTTDLPSLFAEIAPQLEIGEVAKPTRSGAGFHILKLHEKRGETSQVITQNKVRHILLKPSAIMDDEAAKKKLLTIRQDILDNDDFAKLAKEHSEDIGSMLAGGELGWSHPGMFVPEFDKMMNETPITEISKPFRSQFGWHILQVTEQREEDMTDQVIRNKARNVLTGRRFEDELQVWLREIRDDAFVDIKIPVKDS